MAPFDACKRGQCLCHFRVTDITDNPKELIFHVRGGFPSAATLVLQSRAFSALHYTEMPPHTHQLNLVLSTQPGQPDYWPERKPLVTELVELEKPLYVRTSNSTPTTDPSIRTPSSGSCADSPSHTPWATGSSTAVATSTVRWRSTTTSTSTGVPRDLASSSGTRRAPRPTSAPEGHGQFDSFR